MRPALLSRTIHTWLGLIVGIPLVLWTLSGFYMVVVDLDFIHGDPLVRNVRVPFEAKPPPVSFAAVANRFEGVTQVSLRALPGVIAPVYEVTTRTGKALVDSTTGQVLSPLPKDAVSNLAREYYAGAGKLTTLTLIERDAPLEIQTRPLPIWRGDFDDWSETSLYIDPDTGVLVTRRHRFWRWFDFLWMFHIMDFDTRTDMNNALLRTATAAGVVAVLSGGWLLYFSFRRKTPVRRPNSSIGTL
ncbi:PepSY domain-containing protein [Peristeroidobacter agariperforans]|uniref:PepSY domain-containing protein n=1 Tax=Peristeroidobacter agariperforans TaxID=268404 RepID=UPI00101BECA2|nr:PepSY domain-containing protein [Peristeroidobacter agariperforans]